MFKKSLTLFLFIGLCLSVNATNYYVSTSGRDYNNGLSINKPFKTLNQALKKARAGDTIWVKAGNYGRQYTYFPYSGTKNKPISVIGYKNKPGDVKSTYYKYSKGKQFDSRQLPTFNGVYRNSNKIGFTIYNRSYIIIKNIQIQNYRFGISGMLAKNIKLENVLIKNAGGNTLAGIAFRFDNTKNSNNSFKNCIAINASSTGFSIFGNSNLIENCKTYTDEAGKKLTMHYHIMVSGSNNTIKRHYAEHVGNLPHTGHGIVLKSGNYKTENNLIDNCDIVNINGSVEFRHRKVKNNIARNIRIKGKNSRYSGGFHFRDGASNNTVEKSTIDGLKGNNGAFSFYDTTEDGGTQFAAYNNVIKNVIITNSSLGIRLGSDIKRTSIHRIKNNKIINCVFYNVSTFIKNHKTSYNLNNKIQNSIISNSKKYYAKKNYTKHWLETYNNYYGNGFKTPKGSGNISSNPQFVSVTKKNFSLKKTSKNIDAGIKISLVKTDFKGLARPKGKSIDIGAYEYDSANTTTNNNNTIRNNNISVKAYAGKDVRGCSGNRVVLTASGGDRYKWSTGQTTKTIYVYPKTNKKEETFKYTVTAYKGNSYATDDVNVTVKSIPNLNLGSDITIRKGRTVTLSSNVNGRWYKWSNGSNSKSIRVKPNKTTSYRLIVKGYNGCLNNDWVKINVSNNKNAKYLDSDDIKVYPNPTTNWVNITNKTGMNQSYKIVDNYNKTVKSGVVGKSQKISMSNLKKGIYFLRVFSQDNLVVKKIILN